MVLTTPRWTILADFHDEIITDAEGPHVHRLCRPPTAGGATDEIWNGVRPGQNRPPSDQPRVGTAYDDGAVPLSLGADLLYVPKPGECHRWTLKVNEETWLAVYGDAAGVVFWPLDPAHAREAYYVPARRDTLELEHRTTITDAQGIRWAEPLFKRHGDVLVWLDWPSWDQQPCTRYRLAAFNFQTKTGWGRDLDAPRETHAWSTWTVMSCKCMRSATTLRPVSPSRSRRG